MNRKRITVVAILLSVAVAVPALSQRSKEKKPVAEPLPRTNQLLMRDKLENAQKLLEAIAIEDFDMIAESSKMLGVISRAASWHQVNTPDYERYRRNFDEAAGDAEKHAKGKNLDAVAMDYVRMTMSCVQCHQHVRTRGLARWQGGIERLHF